jgi:hypothetical protein
MASKKAKQKKVLDKAKQLVLKNKKGKAKAKPKQSYPEGQNAPQSKAYQIDNDKTQVAKATGWRFTKEGAKRLGKTESDRPTQAEVEKYRNQTFKVKGKVNKSGPKGTGDGSFRYIYIERRADKADLKRNQKLADGGNLRFYEIYDDIVDYIVKNENVTRDVADRIVEKNMTWLRDMVEYQEENNIEYLANAIMSDDDDEYAKGGSIDDKRERVIDYYLNNDVFDDYDTYGLTEQDLMDAKKSKSYKKIEDAIVKYHGLDDDENVKERFETLGLEDDEYAKGGKTKNLPTENDVRQFQEYVFSFYGKDGTYSKFFGKGATTEEVLRATNQYLTFCAKNPKMWGKGDSVDREIVRDIMQYHRGTEISELEHSSMIQALERTTILEYGGILQPMIGGVNADPRFDIYNTTMFAEDGAMLELGGENPDEKLKVTIHVDVYEDDYEEGEGKRVHGYTVDWLKNETIKADDLLNFLGRELGLSNEPNDYTIDDDGYIHTSRLEDSEGLEASQDEIDQWKWGAKKLYSAQYTIIPEAVGQSRKPSQSELHVVTDIPMYEDGGEMAKGGKIKDQYKQFPKGSFKREKGVWNAWTPAQRLHFLNDHADELTFGVWGISKSDFLKISEVDYDGLSDLDDEGDMIGNEIFVSVNDALNKHIQEGQYANGGKTMSRKVLTRRYLQGRAKNIFTFGYGMPKDAIDMYGTKGGSEYFVMPNGDVYKKTTADMHKFELIDVKDKS